MDVALPITTNLIIFVCHPYPQFGYSIPLQLQPSMRGTAGHPTKTAKEILYQRFETKPVVWLLKYITDTKVHHNRSEHSGVWKKRRQETTRTEDEISWQIGGTIQNHPRIDHMLFKRGIYI